jgi:hypothetical protein
LSEHFDALDVSDFDGPLHVGLVGNSAQRREALAKITSRRSVDGTVERASGHEWVTLHAVSRYAQRHDDAVLYAHLKGSAHQWHTDRLSPIDANATAEDGTKPQDCWRRAMTDRMVVGWRDCLRVLKERRCHAVGPMLTVPKVRPELVHFSGNFWMARCDYLRELPRCRTDDRTYAEMWLSGRDHFRPREAPARLRLEPFHATNPVTGETQRYYRVQGFSCATCRAGFGDPHYAPLVADPSGSICCYSEMLPASTRKSGEIDFETCLAHELIGVSLRELVAGGRSEEIVDPEMHPSLRSPR